MARVFGYHIKHDNATALPGQDLKSVAFPGDKNEEVTAENVLAILENKSAEAVKTLPHVPRPGGRRCLRPVIPPNPVAGASDFRW